MVPGAIGTQTNGSIIRPAAFCGIVGYKPSRGLISRVGVLREAPSLDTVGIMARSVEDVALIAEQIMGYDANDKSMSPRARPDLLAHARSDPPYQPRLAFVRTPVWEQAEPETHAAFAELIDALGDHVINMDLPDRFDGAVGWHKIVMEAEIGSNYGAIHKRARDQLSPTLRDTIERGQTIAAADYLAALETIPELIDSLESGFDWVDAFITPAAPGAAPRGLDSTGSPIFCTLWTFTGMPAITRPLLQSSAGMPIGVQLVGQAGRDARLMRTARWLVNFLAVKG
jgi:Asp-tRNA(Asn)/Glu-tRNA(Gln) amidotransferase A subunit family amidase